jgi:hypothetical protein
VMYFHCPYCGQKNLMQEQSLGTIKRCKGCSARLSIPDGVTQEELNEVMRADAVRLTRLAEEAQREERAAAATQAQANLERAKAARTTTLVLLIGSGSLAFMCMSCCVFSSIANMFDSAARARAQPTASPPPPAPEPAPPATKRATPNYDPPKVRSLPARPTTGIARPKRPAAGQE